MSDIILILTIDSNPEKISISIPASAYPTYKVSDLKAQIYSIKNILYTNQNLFFPYYVRNGFPAKLIQLTSDNATLISYLLTGKSPNNTVNCKTTLGPSVNTNISQIIPNIPPTANTLLPSQTFIGNPTNNEQKAFVLDAGIGTIPVGTGSTAKYTILSTDPVTTKIVAVGLGEDTDGKIDMVPVGEVTITPTPVTIPVSTKTTTQTQPSTSTPIVPQGSQSSVQTQLPTIVYKSEATLTEDIFKGEDDGTKDIKPVNTIKIPIKQYDTKWFSGINLEKSNDGVETNRPTEFKSELGVINDKNNCVIS